MKCEDCDGCGEVECECNDCGDIHMTDCIYCAGTGEVEDDEDDDDEEAEHAATMALCAKLAGVPPLKEG